MNEEMEQNLTNICEWIAAQAGSIPEAPSGLTPEERKQLKAVNRSIQQLTNSGVSVPDELRRLKLNLSARDRETDKDGKIENQLQAIEKMIQSLAALRKDAQKVRNELKGLSHGGGTTKRYGVTLLNLLQGGQISTEDELQLQWKKEGLIYEGKFLEDGSVSAKTESGWQRYDSLSAAAATIGERPLNGWEHWRRVNRDGSLTALKEIRTRYIKERVNS